MMKAWMSILLALLLLVGIAGCTTTETDPGPTPPDSEGDGPGETDLIPPDRQVASITPALGEKIAEKKAENGDVVGWLTIPGTDIDDVVLKNPHRNNDYYLNMNFQGEPDSNGTFCADYRCSFPPEGRDGLSRNTTLYGHNFTDDPDGELFSQLLRFRDPDFAREHPYLLFSTAEEDLAFEIFAVYHATVELPYILPDLPWATFQEVLAVAADASLYDYEADITQWDKVLTLSSCTFSVPGRIPLPTDVPNDYRLVIMARLVAPDEEIRAEADFTVQDSPLTPDNMPTIYNPNLDLFVHEGIEYVNVSELGPGEWDTEAAPDLSGGVPAGRILRSGITSGLRDLDAVKLPVGTALYRHEEFPDALIAESAGERALYLTAVGYRDPQRAELAITDPDGTLRTAEISGEEDLDFFRKMLLRSRYLRVSEAELTRTEQRTSLRIKAVFADGTEEEFEVFLAATDALGREILVIRSGDQLRYLEAEELDRLLDRFAPEQ